MESLNTSSAAFYSVFSGQVKELKQPGVWMWVDVRDITEAHVAAIVCLFLNPLIWRPTKGLTVFVNQEKPGAANQRFLISQGTFNMGQLSDFIWKHYPERAQAKGVPKSTLF